MNVSGAVGRSVSGTLRRLCVVYWASKSSQGFRLGDDTFGRYCRQRKEVNRRCISDVFTSEWRLGKPNALVNSGNMLLYAETPASPDCST